ncbi:MAG: nitroreductase family protein [Desulfuromonadales bacterium]|nr:nitroreductase family protein [Desulfuromonadales bacterium]
MIRGSEKRTIENNVDRLFVDRWSPRAMSGDGIPEAELLTLFEAARWAPSSMNNQPGRILYARRDTGQWPLFFNLLVDSNKAWCARAAALLVFVSKTTFESGKPCRTHSYDTGASWMSLALQGSLRGYVVHGMQGFDYEQAKSALNIPDEYQVEAMAAIGLPGLIQELPESLQARETPSERRPLAQTVCEGRFSF